MPLNVEISLAQTLDGRPSSDQVKKTNDFHGDSEGYHLLLVMGEDLV